MNNNFQRAFNQSVENQRRMNEPIAGALGIYLNGVQVVEVPNRPSYVYVRLRSSIAEVIQAFNSRVSPVYDLPVLVQWQGNRYTVTDRDTLRYSNWVDYSAYLPRHASTHEFIGSAGDIVFVSQQQFLPLLPMPSGSIGSPNVVINDYVLMTTTGTFIYSPAQATQNLTVWNPTNPTGAVMVLVSVNENNGALRYDVGSGSVFYSGLTGTNDVLPHVPTVVNIGQYIPIVAVRLVSNTNSITWDNLYDVRPLFGATRITQSAGGGGGGGGGGGTGFLALDTSNGPLIGPLLVTQKLPNNINQYLDFSTIVGYLSGTNDTNFAAAGEFAVWTTGSRSYGVYVDDEAGGANSLYILDQGVMDKTTFQIDDYIDINRRRGTYSSPMVQWNRHGNNLIPYLGPVFRINQLDNIHDTKAGLELDVSSSPYTFLWPNHTGTPFNYPFPGNAPYHFDTANQLKTGSVLWELLHFGEVKAWFGISGEFTARGGMNVDPGNTYKVGGIPHTHIITGVAFNGPFPQPVFGFFGEAAGVPLGSGTILNVRGSNAVFTLSGTTFDLFITGTAGGGGGGAGVDQIGFYAERAGIPLGTGTILNVRGQNFTFTLSGTTADLFLTGSNPIFPQPVLGIYGENVGVPLGTGTTLNVRGNGNAILSLSGTVLDLFITGSPFPQEVIGFAGQQQGVPLGTGSTLNVRGPMLSLTLSGTTFDLFATGVVPVYPQPVFGIFGENQGVPLGTGTIFNIRGQNYTFTLSGTTLDLFLTGTLPSGPAGGDLTGVYPNPQVMWGNGTGYYGTVFAPRIHAPQHLSGGFDPLSIDLLAPATYPAGNYLDASTGSHGLMRVLSGDPTNYIGGDGLEHSMPAEREELYLEDATLYVTGTHSLITTYPSGTQASVSQSITSSTTGTMFAVPFMSAAGLFNFVGSQETRIIVTANITVGTKIVYLYSQLLKYSSSGTEILLGSSNLHLVTASQLEFDLGMPIPDTIFDPTERLELKFFGISQGAGSTPTVTVYYDGTTSSRVEVGADFKGGGVTVVNNFNGLMGWNSGVPLGTGTTLNARGGATLTLSGTVLDLFVTGVAPVYPQPVFGFYGENNGIPLGSGTIFNLRGQNYVFTLSGTTFDLFLTGTASGGGTFAGVDQIGFYAENAGTPLGTGTILNVRGQNYTFTLSGTTADLFLTGSLFPQSNIGVFGENQGIPLGTGTIFNVRGSNATLTISGTTLDLFVSGSASGNLGVWSSGTFVGNTSALNFLSPLYAFTGTNQQVNVGATGVMLISTYDPNANGVVNDSESTQALRGRSISTGLTPNNNETIIWNSTSNQYNSSLPFIILYQPTPFLNSVQFLTFLQFKTSAGMVEPNGLQTGTIHPPLGFIQEGSARLTYITGSSYRVEAGDVDAAGTELVWTSPLVRTGLSLTSGSIYYVYLWASGTSPFTPALEESTVAPVLDSTNSYLMKTGDSTRRLLGYLIASNTNTIKQFMNTVYGRTSEMLYLDGIQNIVLNAAISTGSWTAFTISPWAPPFCSYVNLLPKITFVSALDEASLGIAPVNMVGIPANNNPPWVLRITADKAGEALFLGTFWQAISQSGTMYARQLNHVGSLTTDIIQVQGARFTR